MNIRNLKILTVVSALLSCAFFAWAEGAGVVGEAISQGQRLASLGAAGVLGFVCLACIGAIVYQYKDSRADRDKLYTLIAENTAAHQAATETQRATTEILVEVKAEMLQCRAGRQNQG